MEFIETPTFTRLVLELLEDDDYRRLQTMLATRPDCGDVIPGGGGIRKVRFGFRGKGKRGGVRVIYYWLAGKFRIFMLLVYAKAEKEDLTEDQKRVLQLLVKELRDG